MIIQPQMHYLDYLYGPRDVDHNFYETITKAYEDVCLAKGWTPHIEEVEEWLFRGVINQISSNNRIWHRDDQDYQRDAYVRREVDDAAVRSFVDEYSDVIARDIKKCLDHAKVAYIGYQETSRGTTEILINSAQVDVTADVYGWEDLYNVNNSS